MRHRSYLAALAATAVAAAGGALALHSAAPAAADTVARLPLTGRPSGFAVDGVHRRIFIADADDGVVLATDYAGTVLATFDGLPGVGPLTLAPDSGHVYAAQQYHESIVSIATATLRLDATYPTGDGVEPVFVAATGGRIWFSYGGDNRAGVGAVDPSGATPQVSLGLDPDEPWFEAPRLTAGPGGLLAAGGSTTGGNLLTVFDTAGGTLHRGASTTEQGGRGVSTFTADGRHLITAAGDHDQILSTADLTPDGEYATGRFAEAVAVAPDGRYATSAFWSSDHVALTFQPGASTPLRRIEVPETALPDGLAWEPGGTRLLMLVEEGNAVDYSLRWVDEPLQSHSTITLTVPGTAPRGGTVVVSGTVTGADPIAPDTLFTVTRTDLATPGGTRLDPVSPDADGRFSFVDVPPAGGTVRYTVAYAGDSLHLAATGSGSVAVARDQPALTLDHNGQSVAYGSKQTFTAHLGSASTNRTVEIWADPAGSEANRLIKRGTVDSRGNVAAPVTLYRTTVLTAVFAGDARYAARTVVSTVATGVQVSSVLTKQYKTGRIGSTSYAYFRRTTNPVVTTTMTAYPGRRQDLVVQTYTKGTWKATSSRYYALSSKGTSAVTLGGKHTKGARLRVRAAYLKGGSGDSANATTYGAWKYLTFS